MRIRWKDDDGAIYEWDYAHGTVENITAGVITKANLIPTVVGS